MLILLNWIEEIAVIYYQNQRKKLLNKQQIKILFILQE